MNMVKGLDEIERICKINDQLFLYDECVEKGNDEDWQPPEKKGMIYLGEGEIWSIGGACTFLPKQPCVQKCFFRWNNHS